MVCFVQFKSTGKSSKKLNSKAITIKVSGCVCNGSDYHQIVIQFVVSTHTVITALSISSLTNQVRLKAVDKLANSTVHSIRASSHFHRMLFSSH